MNGVIFNGATPSAAHCIAKIDEEDKLWVKTGLLQGGDLPWAIGSITLDLRLCGWCWVNPTQL